MIFSPHGFGLSFQTCYKVFKNILVWPRHYSTIKGFWPKGVPSSGSLNVLGGRKSAQRIRKCDFQKCIARKKK